MRRVLPIALMVAWLCSDPAMAQIYGGTRTRNQSSNPSGRPSYQFDNSPEQEPSLGTIPGIYYDPSAQLGPSMQEMNGSSKPGVITHPPAPLLDS
ncbi:hypothetical protein, partial [Chroococcus sp. FPU101]|uniref:hypothetical protein n=1 Tax=Chroococcus sp. FPU101 TaxID=1974212 RepID=UPI001A8BFCF8